MIREVVPFKHWHYNWMVGRSEKYIAGLGISIESLKYLEGQNSWTGVVDGSVIICAGTLTQWQGRHQAWAHIAAGVAPHMRWVTEQVCANLDKVQGRIELTVRAAFKPGLRWAKRLGFSVETPLLKQFGPFGEDHVGFVRIN